MQHHVVLHIVAKTLMPVIMVFALYVQFHGDYGPGGGFQAGVIFGATFILYAIIFGNDTALKTAPISVVRACSAVGVLLYVAVGVVAMLKGGEFLNYSALLPDPVKGQHLGIYLIELGVGITVACVMVNVFFTFVTYGGKADDMSEQ